MITATIEKYLDAIDGESSTPVQQFTAPFPVEVITTMLGVPRRVRPAGPRVGPTTTLHRDRPDRVRRAGLTGRTSRTRRCSIRPGCRTSRRPATTCSVMLIAAEIEREDGQKTAPQRSRNHGLPNATRRSGRRDGDQAGRQRRLPVRQHPDQWQKLLDDPNKIPGRRRGTATLRSAGASTTCAASLGEITLHGVTIPPRNPVFLSSLGEPRSPRMDGHRHVRHRRDRRSPGRPRIGLQHPQLSRRGVARMESAPTARRTWLGRATPALQADPVEHSTPRASSSMSRASPSAPGKDRCALPGSQPAGASGDPVVQARPVELHVGHLRRRTPSTSRPRRAASRAARSSAGADGGDRGHGQPDDRRDVEGARPDVALPAAAVQ